METVPVIDADSHLTEPPDLWTKGLSRKWREVGPHMELDSATGATRWRLGDKWLFNPGSVSHAGWDEFPPSNPQVWSEIEVACYDALERAKWMDTNGISAQVLYPNLVAFEGYAIIALGEPKLQEEIVRVYNDFLMDFANRAPGRFIPVAALPFWDREASIKEMQRCAAMGHRGVLWAGTLAGHGLPATTDSYWDPFYAEAQELGMSINFHVGVGWTAEDFKDTMRHGKTFDVRFHTGLTSVALIPSNARTIADVILSGLCERFPRLNFVSVESGFGWIPFLLESLDWHWKNYNGPGLMGGLLPSEYFKRQIYGMFWFEESSLRLFDLYPDNIMFETDFPHATSLSPGPGSAAPSAATIVARAKERLDSTTFEKVMYRNAARVYRTDI